MLRVRAVVLAAALILAPFGARAADLVVWWQKGYYAQEEAALREIVAAFEQETGKQVELVFHDPAEAPDKTSKARIAASLRSTRGTMAAPSAAVAKWVRQR